MLARSQIQEVFPLAACPRLAENSRLGFATVASTSQWASGFSISSNTLGLSPSLYDGRVRPRSTGKERDAESGNDYFGARYYSSAMGRFMSPDWSAKVAPVPYAKLNDPQTMNLYAYVGNNPMTSFDPDGHDEKTPQKIVDAANAQAAKGSEHYDQSNANVSNGQLFKPGQDKCNEFVSDTLKSADGVRPVVTETGKIPTASQFADPKVTITGLSAPKPISDAKPGDVIAQYHGTGANGNAEGHVGIVVGPGQTVSANAKEGGKVTSNDWGFRSPTANPNNGERNGAASPPPVVRHPL